MKKTTVRAIGVTILMFVSAFGYTVYSQSSEGTGALSASGVIKKGDDAYKAANLTLAEAYYKQYLTVTPESEVPAIVWLKQADCYWQLREFNKCLTMYESMFKYNHPKLGNKDNIRLSELYARTKNYANAYKWLKGIPGYEVKAEGYNDSKKRLEMERDSDCWEVKVLNINPEYRMFAPTLVDSVLLFSSNRPSIPKNQSADFNSAAVSQLWQVSLTAVPKEPEVTKQPQRDPMQFVKNEVVKKRLAGVYEIADVAVQRRDRYAYKIRQSLVLDEKFEGKPVAGFENSRYQALSVSMDSARNIYFSTTDKNNNVRLKEGKYTGTEVTDIKEINLGKWGGIYASMHPAVNKNGTVLVFSSDQQGGRGGYDLYASTRKDKTQEWSKPQNLSSFNTAGNEVFPTITPDDYLYFSSDGMAGLGGLDIYRIKLTDALDNKEAVEHLGIPINSPGDDYGWAQYKDNQSGYFTSDRANSNDNIYNFHYTPKVTLSGTVKNRLTGDPIADASVFVYDKQKGQVYVHKTDEHGNYSVRVSKGGDAYVKAVINPYDTVFQHRAFNESSAGIPIHNSTNNMPHNEFSLTKLSLGTAWQLDTIYYGFDKWDIQPVAYPILDSVVTLLKAYPMMRVEIGSYADKRGTVEYNLWLSQQRANAIVNYIVRKGVSVVRIKARGYGKTRLIEADSSDVATSEKTDQINRRSEIKVSGFEQTPGKSIKTTIDDTKYKQGDVIDPKSLPDNFFAPEFPFPANNKKTDGRVSSLPVTREREERASSGNLPATYTLQKKKEHPLFPKVSEQPFIRSMNNEYVIQAAASGTRIQANILMHKISKILPATVHCFVLEDAPYFKVQVGPFKHYQAAVDLLADISRTIK